MMSGSLDVGLAISSARPSKEVLEAASVAVDAGFTSLWISDLRFWRDCYVLMGALSQRVPGVRLVSGVSDPFSRHPGLVAMAAATLAELTSNKFTLGLGAGGTKLGQMGAERKAPLRTVEDAIASIRTLFSGGRVSVENPGFSMYDLELSFDASELVLDIALIAHGPKMYELAGRIADRACVANYVSPDGITWALDNIDHGARSASRVNEPRLCLRLDVAVSQDPSQAHRVVEDRVRTYIRIGYYGNALLGPLGFHEPPAPNDDSSIRDIARRVALSGGPTEVSEGLSKVVDPYAWDELSLQIFPVPGQSLAEAVEQLGVAVGMAGLFPT